MIKWNLPADLIKKAFHKGGGGEEACVVFLFLLHQLIQSNGKGASMWQIFPFSLPYPPEVGISPARGDFPSFEVS